jgi:ribose-phosphate pyrophosphokinase
METSVIISLDSCKELGDKISEQLNCMKTKIFKFNNNEINISPCESVREKNVFIIGSGSNYGGTINDNVIEMLSIVRACRDASAKHITLICAYFPYCRSDKKDQGRAPIMAKLMCDLFKTAGVNRLITFDLHAAQIQGFFDGPFDNLYAGDDLIACLKNDHPNDGFIVISPDVGGIKRIKDFGSKLNAEYTFLVKSRDHDKISHINHHELVHQLDLTGKINLLVDDIGDTLGTLNSAAKLLKEKGAPYVIAIITHGIFSGKAFDLLEQDHIDKIYVTNTLPQQDNMKKSKKIEVVDLSTL